MVLDPMIILMSHGFMAKETLQSAQMIVGNSKSMFTVSMLEEDGLSGTNEKLSQVLKNIDKLTPILIIADLKGGTPCNVALLKMQEYSNLRVLTGLNLAITIEAMLAQQTNIDELTDYLLTIGKEAVCKIALMELDDDECEE